MHIIIPTEKELRKAYKLMIAQIKAMTPEERFQSLVKAGIYTKKGKLTKKYADWKK